MVQEMVYSEERKTWNLFVDGEWYAEGDYDYIEKMYENNLQCEDEEDYYEDYSDMRTCDIAGICGGPSCPQYYSCQG